MIKMLVCDFDGTLDGGPSEGVNALSHYLTKQAELQFVIATGRTFPSICDGLRGDNYSTPNSIISDVGTQIHHNHSSISNSHYPDEEWHNYLEQNWTLNAIQDSLRSIDFLGKQNAEHQGDYKVTIEGKLTRNQLDIVEQTLASNQHQADLTYSHDWFLDITPKGINKAAAIKHLANKHKLAMDEICVAGDSANDTSMLTMTGVNSILVANHYPEVAYLRERTNIYTSRATHSAGVLEGLQYWQSSKNN